MIGEMNEESGRGEGKSSKKARNSNIPCDMGGFVCLRLLGVFNEYDPLWKDPKSIQKDLINKANG